MKKPNCLLEKLFKPYILDKYGNIRGNRIMKRFNHEFRLLCQANPDEPRAVKRHTVGNAYPLIAFYRALLQEGESKDDALQFLDEVYSAQMEKTAALMRGIMKIPFLYKIVPVMWHIVTPLGYGRNAGFDYHFYKVGMKRVKFDMKKCIYCDVCRKNGCPELVPIFCHSDDINNENMHPLLKWNRTKMMGRGADVCDFDVIVLDKKKK